MSKNQVRGEGRNGESDQQRSNGYIQYEKGAQAAKSDELSSREAFNGIRYHRHSFIQGHLLLPLVVITSARVVKLVGDGLDTSI